MIKTIALMRRKPGMTREAFAQHYEAVHAPLALRLLPSMRGYTRNHVVSVLGNDVAFDCLSVFWHDSLDAAVDVLTFLQSDAGTPLRDDEETFLDRDKIVSFVVEETPTLLPKAEQRPALVKAIALLKGKAGLTRAEFVDHYEHVHVPLIVQHSAGMVGYARNYVGVTPAAADPPFDSVTELWYRDRQAYDAVLQGRHTKGGQDIQRDEETFLDTARTLFLLVNERVSKLPSGPG